MLEGSRKLPLLAARGGVMVGPLPQPPASNGPPERGERERVSRTAPTAARGPPLVAIATAGTFATLTFTASKPECDLFVALRCTVNSMRSPCLSGAARCWLLLMPTKRSPGYFCDVTKPHVSWKLRTRPEHCRPTRSLSSVLTACTLVAWHLPLEPSEMSKVTMSPTLKPVRPGLEPWCRNRSPSKSSETTKPQPSRKLRTTPRARWPTKASGPGFGSPRLEASALGTVTGALASTGMGCGKASMSCFTFTAWMPLAAFSSRAI
mmetsp:Transcript_12882/g.35672  ORF Transcript_12882/g.35672 Transcript_12882/m.35672 type:complete len:264 (+) Transcript_12882:269-1060(+)